MFVVVAIIAAKYTFDKRVATTSSRTWSRARTAAFGLGSWRCMAIMARGAAQRETISKGSKETHDLKLGVSRLVFLGAVDRIERDRGTGRFWRVTQWLFLVSWRKLQWWKDDANATHLFYLSRLPTSLCCAYWIYNLKRNSLSEDVE